MKPELTAPGENVISTLSQWAVPERPTTAGLHQWLSGTSMSAPVVTGAAALYLQQNPTANFTDVLGALTAQAKSDGITGTVPNNNWGYGKLDLFAAMTNGSMPQAMEQVFTLSAGESVDGSLSSTEDRLVYRLILDSATEVGVDLFPTLLFDPVVDMYRGTSLSYLGDANRVERTNGGGLGTPERFQRTLNAGHYLFVVSASEGGSLGTYTLKVSSLVGLLSLGEVVTDRLVETTSSKTYQLVLDEATDLTINLVPDSNLNPVLNIFSGTLPNDDLRVGRVDSGEVGSLKRFKGRLEAGTYLIVVSENDVAGGYTLSVDDFGSVLLLMVIRQGLTRFKYLVMVVQAILRPLQISTVMDGWISSIILDLLRILAKILRIWISILSLIWTKMAVSGFRTLYCLCRALVSRLGEFFNGDL